MFSLLFFSLAPACTGLEIGAAEDSLGQPRGLLANCTRSGGENGGFPHTVYDGEGYQSQLLYVDGIPTEERSTTVDAQGRPVRRVRGLGETVWSDTEISYVDDSWRISERKVSSEFYGDEHWAYSWGSGGVALEDVQEVPDEERRCRQVHVFAVGLRPELVRSYCEDEAFEFEYDYTWSEDRLARVREFNRFGLQEVVLREYRYNAEGRLAAETWTADLEGDGIFDAPATQKYSWSCN